MSDPSSESSFGSSITRRDFVKGLTALGGAALIGSRPSQAALPGRYTFYRVLDADDVGVITAAVMVSSGQPYIFFHGTLLGTSGDLDTIFVARMDWGGSRPTAQQVGPLLFQQLTLSRNNVVGATNDVFCDRIGTGDVNSLGHFATTISGSSDSTTVPLSAPSACSLTVRPAPAQDDAGSAGAREVAARPRPSRRAATAARAGFGGRPAGLAGRFAEVALIVPSMRSKEYAPIPESPAFRNVSWGGRYSHFPESRRKAERVLKMADPGRIIGLEAGVDLSRMGAFRTQVGGPQKPGPLIAF